MRTLLKLILRKTDQDYYVLATNIQQNDSIFFPFTQALRSYLDIVFGPVDTTDGHA